MSDQLISDKILSYGCIRCGALVSSNYVVDSRGCAKCHPSAPSNFEVVYTAEALAGRSWPGHKFGEGFWRYERFLPVSAEEAVSLGEGDTPLVRAENYGATIGLENLFLKDESRNPTWSHKDRLSTVAVSFARSMGTKILATSSSGNAGASLAAYAAKAGLPCIVLTFEGAAGPMVSQIRKYGAMVLQLSDKRDRWPMLCEGVRRFGWFATSPFAAPVVGSHPIGNEGYKTIAYEIYEQLAGKVPDWVVVPTAYGDIVAGIWRGFRDLVDAGISEKMPRMVAAEIYGSLEKTLASGADSLAIANRPFDTTAISIGTSQGAYQALKALRETNGAALSVDNTDLLRAQEELASFEGIFGELASVAPIAAVKKLRQSNKIKSSETVVCLLSASGLKDLDCSVDPHHHYPTADPGMDNAVRYLSEQYQFHMSEVTEE